MDEENVGLEGEDPEEKLIKDRELNGSLATPIYSQVKA